MEVGTLGSNYTNKTQFCRVMTELVDVYKSIIRNDRWWFKFVLIDMMVYISVKYMIINADKFRKRKIVGRILTAKILTAKIRKSKIYRYVYNGR